MSWLSNSTQHSWSVHHRASIGYWIKNTDQHQQELVSYPIDDQHQQEVTMFSSCLPQVRNATRIEITHLLYLSVYTESFIKWDMGWFPPRHQPQWKQPKLYICCLQKTSYILYICIVVVGLYKTMIIWESFTTQCHLLRGKKQTS